MAIAKTVHALVIVVMFVILNVTLRPVISSAKATILIVWALARMAIARVDQALTVISVVKASHVTSTARTRPASPSVETAIALASAGATANLSARQRPVT